MRLTRADFACTKFQPCARIQGHACLREHHRRPRERRLEWKKLQESTAHTQTSRSMYAKERLSKRVSHLYHSENLQSFFRRLPFHRGKPLGRASGVFKYDSRKDFAPEVQSSQIWPIRYTFTLARIQPTSNLSPTGLMKPAIAVAFNPIKYELTDSTASSFLHCLTSWFCCCYPRCSDNIRHGKVAAFGNADKTSLSQYYRFVLEQGWQKPHVSSAEGFCSLIVFESNVFGTNFNPTRQKEKPATHSQVKKHDSVANHFSDRQNRASIRVKLKLTVVQMHMITKRGGSKSRVNMHCLLPRALVTMRAHNLPCWVAGKKIQCVTWVIFQAWNECRHMRK